MTTGILLDEFSWCNALRLLNPAFYFEASVVNQEKIHSRIF